MFSGSNEEPWFEKGCWGAHDESRASTPSVDAQKFLFAGQSPFSYLVFGS